MVFANQNTPILIRHRQSTSELFLAAVLVNYQPNTLPPIAVIEFCHRFSSDPLPMIFRPNLNRLDSLFRSETMFLLGLCEERKDLNHSIWTTKWFSPIDNENTSSIEMESTTKKINASSSLNALRRDIISHTYKFVRLTWSGNKGHIEGNYIPSHRMSQNLNQWYCIACLKTWVFFRLRGYEEADIWEGKG